MVNAGAIACIGLTCESDANDAFERARTMLGRFAGRRLKVDEPTFRSARESGDRSRAIAYLLRHHGILQGDVDKVLDVYFRQSSLRVSARDLSVMAATLANKGSKPLTDEQVASSQVVARTLSVMTGSGMSDSAGGWVYRAGSPAAARVEVVFSGIPKGTPAEQSLRDWLADRPGVHSIGLLDETIEWAEDRIINSQDGDLYRGKPVDIAGQELLAGLDVEELAARPATRASKLGVATPVDEMVTVVSTSEATQPAAASARVAPSRWPRCTPASPRRRAIRRAAHRLPELDAGRREDCHHALEWGMHDPSAA